MSSKLHGLVWEGCASAGLGISRVALMARLADYSNADGVSWPAIETLRIEIGAKSDTTVKSALRELVEGGWIKKLPRKIGGRNLTNIYQINIEKLEFAALAGRKKIQEERAKKTGSRAVPAEGANITPSVVKGANIDPSNFEGSKNVENGQIKGANIDPDPSLTSDPSLTPTHNAGEEQIGTGNENLIPDYPGQPGMLTTAAQMIGKFAMHPDWRPSDQFRAQAVLWGMPVREGINLRAELNNFITYWQAEGKVFHQAQWEQKFARHLQRAGQQTSRGNQNAGAESGSTANRAVQQIRAARAQRLRERGEGVEVLGNDGRDLLQPLDYQKRIGAVGPMDCSDWEFDQRPDDERV